MVPFQYRTTVLNTGLFGGLKRIQEMIQEEIDKQASEGWELFQYCPAPTGGAWQYHVFIFRKPKGQM